MTHVTGKQKHDEHVRTWRLAQPCPVECLHCGWRAEGPLAVTRQLYANHRREAHPDLPKPRSRIKRRPGGWQTGAKRIEDNIAQARTQGAGRNAA